MSPDLAAFRTLLFVPGDRADRFEKALGAGADGIILDLEDAVAPSSKNAARAMVAAWLNADKPVLLRINGARSEWFEEDLTICRHPAVAAIILPKSEPGPALLTVARLRPTIALVETAVGVRDMPAITVTPGVVRLAIGAIDLLDDLGISASQSVLDPILLQMSVASRAAGIAAPIAGVTIDFRHPSLVEADARRARSLGFSGKFCIHPAQIAPVLKGLRPSLGELERARQIIAADSASAGAAVALDGSMVDRAVVENARRLTAQYRPGEPDTPASALKS